MWDLYDWDYEPTDREGWSSAVVYHGRISEPARPWELDRRRGRIAAE